MRMDIYQFFSEHGIEFERYDHPAVFTCEEATRLCPPMPDNAIKTKNLFLRDKKGRRHFLVTVPEWKQIHVKALEVLLEASKLSFASPQRLERYLKLTPGSVTILGILHDAEHKVEVLIDTAVWKADAIRCHPLVNTSTLVIPLSHLQRLFQLTGHEPRILDIPEKTR
ncbi:MAG: prolyl-tRNA synthetase associated domain-containing protein [bacterium]|nr:prolyl-tRNA synthetase associated domain-containing protein [bacterium]